MGANPRARREEVPAGGLRTVLHGRRLAPPRLPASRVVAMKPPRRNSSSPSGSRHRCSSRSRGGCSGTPVGPASSSRTNTPCTGPHRSLTGWTVTPSRSVSSLSRDTVPISSRMSSPPTTARPRREGAVAPGTRARWSMGPAAPVEHAADAAEGPALLLSPARALCCILTVRYYPLPVISPYQRPPLGGAAGG